MRTKLLCITVLVFTVLIFGANHYAARNPFQEAACPRCDCEAFSIPNEKKATSCSVVFRFEPSIENIGRYTGPRLFEEFNDYTVSISTACEFVVFCDQGQVAGVDCGGYEFHQVVVGGTKCEFRCGTKPKVSSRCPSWTRPIPPSKMEKKRNKKKASSPLPTSALSMFLASTKTSPSTIADFLPATYNVEPFDEEEKREIITGSTQWRLLDGEAGIETGILTVATGQAEARSFCSGDLVRLVGPGTITLPTCQVDVSGSWRGAYARRLSNGTTASVPVTLNLQRGSGSLRGELTTPDGVFKIASASQSGSDLELKAVRTVDGKTQEILLRANFTKGEIVFDGSEKSPDATYYLSGFVARLYIADGALPLAAVNQPYSLALVALSPSGKAVTFRLTGGRLPRGISLDNQSGALSGTPTELGNFDIRVVADDGAGNVFEQPLTLVVKKLVITTRLLPDAFVGQPYAATLKVIGGKPPYRFSGIPPKGLQLDPNTGELSGTPSSLSTDSGFEVTVRDSEKNVETQRVSLQLRGTTILTSYFLPEATQGEPYRAQFQAVGNSSPIYWSFTGIGSTGLTLNPQTGELSGTPTKAGAFPFSVKAQASDGHSRNFALIINHSNHPPATTEPTKQPGTEAAPSSVTTMNWSYGVSEHRGKNGQRFTYFCPPNGRHFYIYGTDVYTDDSSVCTAAVHAGLITFESGGSVTIEMRPGQSSYAASTRNGVTTRSYGSYSGSYVFVR